jgi:hypothetical protein
VVYNKTSQNGYTFRIPGSLEARPGIAPPVAQGISVRPNPFSGFHTKITVLPRTTTRFADIQVKIYTYNGKLVRTITARENPERQYQCQWDGRDRNGRKMAPGIYLARVALPGLSDVKQILLLP